MVVHPRDFALNRAARAKRQSATPCRQTSLTFGAACASEGCLNLIKRNVARLFYTTLSTNVMMMMIMGCRVVFVIAGKLR